jgi:hypothetical protein
MMLVLLLRGIYDVRHSDGPRWHDIYVPSFEKFDTDIQAILRLYFRNVRDFTVSFTDRGDL